MGESRREQRFATSMPVRFEHGEGIARNVSASGIFFVTDMVLEVGATVRFTLEFEDLPQGPVQVNCVGRIVRVERQGEQKGVAAKIEDFAFFRLPKLGERN